jgi:hypothetical protein
VKTKRETSRQKVQEPPLPTSQSSIALWFTTRWISPLIHGLSQDRVPYMTSNITVKKEQKEAARK